MEVPFLGLAKSLHYNEAIPIKCFVSHRPPPRDGRSVGRAKIKKKKHMKGSECQRRRGC